MTAQQKPTDVGGSLAQFMYDYGLMHLDLYRTLDGSRTSWTATGTKGLGAAFVGRGRTPEKALKSLGRKVMA